MRVVLVKSVLYVESRGHEKSKTAPKADRAAVMHGDAAVMQTEYSIGSILPIGVPPGAYYYL